MHVFWLCSLLLVQESLHSRLHIASRLLRHRTGWCNFEVDYRMYGPGVTRRQAQKWERRHGPVLALSMAGAQGSYTRSLEPETLVAESAMAKEMWPQCEESAGSFGRPSSWSAVLRSSEPRRLGDLRRPRPSRLRTGCGVRRADSDARDTTPRGAWSISSWTPLPCMAKMMIATEQWQRSWGWMMRRTASSSHLRAGKSGQKTTTC